MTSQENKITTVSSSSSTSSASDEFNNSKKPKYILITNGDSYVGHTIAMYIAEELSRKEGQLKKKHWRVRVLCHNKKNCEDLERRGIEVKEVDYKSQAMIREQMRDHIKTIIFNPFSKNGGNFIENGKNVIESACHMKIKRIMMISMMGCSQFKDEQLPMGKFYCLEEHIRCTYKYGYWVVFRIPMVQQMFYLWSKMIQSKSAVGMPISESNVLQNVNIKDVCECLSETALSKKSMVWINQIQDIESTSKPNDDINTTKNNDDNDKQDKEEPHVSIKRVYDLASTKHMNIFMIAEAITRAFKEEGFDNEIVPMVISEEQLEHYLKQVSKGENVDAILATIFSNMRNSKSADSATIVNSLASRFMSLFKSDNISRFNLGHKDDPKWYPHPDKYLTPFQIKVILDNFRYSRSPCAPVLPPTNKDVRDITGRDPVELDEFFMNNRRQFRPENDNL